ncbi:hypothetical protein HL653_13825 [Sphingomonas sp. AP4-R1]|uniref:hypothetical protein n=1 Tax=Sphingomonas sp. AP4-R1 TaxID=2735134 RepID=UPI001493DB33|nr:hypothetical protein [Sphingomonas sp. AP4-R1]QJU58702.1 hypothetical protein HL653_13825 [Sphingomonas sp. AP4-R1]
MRSLFLSFMRSLFLFPVALSFAATLAAPAFAQDAASDVRCMMVANAFATTEKDEPKKRFAIESAQYYFGRVDARLTPAQLKAQVMTIAKTLTPPMMAPAMNACVQRVQQRRAMMQQIGKEMTAAAAKPAPGAVKK